MTSLSSSHHDETRPLLLDGDTESQPQSQSQRRRNQEDGAPPPSPQLSTSSSLLSSRPPVHLKRRLRSLVPSLSTLNVINDSSQARDHLASERTFLAWIRTSLTLASIGIALAHFVGTGGVGPEDRGGVVGPDSIVGRRAWEAEGSRGSEYMQYVMIRNLMVEMEQMETRIRELEEWKEKKLAESETLSDDEAAMVADAPIEGAQQSRLESAWTANVASGSKSSSQLPFQGSPPSLEATISNSSDSSKHGRGRTHVRTSLSAFAKPLGCSFVSLGLLTLGLGTRRYFIVQKRLSEGKMAASRGETATMSLLVGALLVAILASILGTIAVEHSG